MTIYNRQGYVLRSRKDYAHWMSCYCARFKRETDMITYVTIARHTYKYCLTNIHARILMFYDDKIGYILNMDVVDISDSETSTNQGNYKAHDYLLDIMKPDGITELRFIDLPVCFEAFYTTKLMFMNIVNKTPIIKIFVDNLMVPKDVADMIYERNVTRIWDIINTKPDRPFKVQGNRHGYKNALYRIVTSEHCDEEDDWHNVCENDYDSD